MNLAASASLAIALATTACMPKYTHDAAPLYPPAAGPAEQCYRGRRMEVAAGTARWTFQRSGGTNMWGNTVIVTETWGAGGLTFYRSGQRFDARRALAELGDQELRRSYEDILARTATDHARYPLWRNLSLGLAFSGLGLAVGGLAVTLADPEAAADNKDGLKLAIAGAGVALLSIIPAILASRTYEGAITHDRYRTLFSESSFAPRLASAVEGHNRRAAASCGHPTADVPMTANARRHLGL